MKILTNIEIDENKFKEFLYTNFSGNDDSVYIEDLSDEKYIYLKTGDFKFKLPVLFDYEIQKIAMYKTLLLKKYNKNLAWGSLVGVRPTKLVNKLLEKNTEDEVKKILSLVYNISDEKIKLLFNILNNQKGYIDTNTISIYIGLAFCPTKCTYCSFPAYLKKGKYLEHFNEYFNCILDEIEQIGNIVKEYDLKIGEIYIGGGTPSYLSYNELEKLLKTVISNFNFSNLCEYTFEAGRIDTLDDEKLKLLKKYLVDRISINPQSFNENTLKKVNRYHSQEKLDKIYLKAKSLGLIINMDFIMGLPNETTNDMLNTLKKLEEYDAENVTIHFLAMKTSSLLTKQKYDIEYEKVNFKKVYESIYEYAMNNNYLPYYMYRQKESVREAENIGFCKKDYQSRYNIYIIEENKNILSIGAGSITKLINNGKIQRITNPKDPIMYVLEYSKRIENKKEEIKKFYDEKNSNNGI